MFKKFFDKKQKLVLIAGCSNFGSNIAGLLSSNNWDVIVVDKDKESFCKLPENFDGLTVLGDACDTTVLESAFIDKALICIASTESDNVNSLISQIASKVYNVNNIFARINDLENFKTLQDNNIHIICPSSLCVKEFNRQSSLISVL